jgi:catechol 2,3-dioxygenase-like lactoylglutathione lyase family enzyme
MLDHLRLSVGDVAEAHRLYDPLMRCLGFAPEGRDDDGVAWGKPDDRGRMQWLILTPASRTGEHDAAAPGLHHVAFMADSRAVVDRAHEIAVAAGAEVLDPPQDFSYEPGYYATFFRDPNGFKLEVVNLPGTARAPNRARARGGGRSGR